MLRTIAVIATGLLACGPDYSRDEAPVSPTTIEYSPPFTVRYGTALLADDFLEIVFSRDGNVCPFSWQQAKQSDRDLAVLEVTVPLVNGSYLRSWAIDPSGNYVIPDAADVWAFMLKNGSDALATETVQALTARSGSVTVTEIVADVHVAGTVALQFDVGAPITLDFDVPFCTIE